MATMLGSLLVSLGLESGEFKSGLDAAETEMKKTARKFERIGKDLQGIGKKLTAGLTAPIAGIGIAFGRAAGSMAKESKAMANSARLAGSSFEDFQRQAYAARTGVGIEFEKLGDIFKDTQDKIGDFSANGGGEMADFFENIAPKVGLTAKAFQGLSGKDGLQLYYNALEKAGVSSDQMVFYLESIADEASGLIPLLRDNGKAFKELGANATIISKADAAELQEYTKAQLQLEAAVRKLTIAFVNSGLLDVVVDLVRSLADLADRASQASPTMFKLAAGGLAVLAALGPVIYTIGGITKVIAPAIAAVTGFQATMALAGIQITKTTAALALLRAGFVAILPVLGTAVAVIGVLAAGYFLLTRRTREQQDATARYSKVQAESKQATDRAASAAERLAYAHGMARAEALALAKAERENVKQKLASATASLKLAQAELIRAKAQKQAKYTAAFGAGGPAGTSTFIQGQGDKGVAAARENLASMTKTVRELTASLNEVNAAINAPTPSIGNVAPVSSGSAGGAGASGPSGPTATEIQRRFEDELISYAQQSLSAMQQLAMSVEERAELELRSVEWARRQAVEQIKADQDYNAAQKAELVAAVDRLATYERQAIELRRMQELERERNDLLQIAFDNERELLALQGDVADTEAQRKAIAMDILRIEQEYRRNQLEMLAASEIASDAERRRAQAILDSLDAIEAGERAAAERRNETSVERYLRDLNKSPEQINEAIDAIKIRGLENLNDALADAIVNFKSLGDVAKDVVKSILADLLRLQIQQLFIKPLANALFSGSGIPGFARGTSFAPGGLAVVGERGPELVNLPRGAQVFSNSESQRMMGGGRDVNMTIYTPDADSFRRSQRQIQRDGRRRLNI